jgi:hypothetical protein
MFSNTAGCATCMFIRPTSTRPAEQEVMARRATIYPSDPHLCKHRGEEIGRTSSLPSLYFATNFKDVITAIPKVRTVLPDKHENTQPVCFRWCCTYDTCRIGQRHCQKEGSLSLVTRRGFSSGRLSQNTSTLRHRALHSRFIPSWPGNS